MWGSHKILSYSTTRFNAPRIQHTVTSDHRHFVGQVDHGTHMSRNEAQNFTHSERIDILAADITVLFVYPHHGKVAPVCGNPAQTLRRAIAGKCLRPRIDESESRVRSVHDASEHVQ